MDNDRLIRTLLTVISSISEGIESQYEYIDDNRIIEFLEETQELCDSAIETCANVGFEPLSLEE